MCQNTVKVDGGLLVQVMATNVLLSEGSGLPSADCGLRIAESINPRAVPQHACCASCGETGGSCGAMPQAVNGRNITMACVWCFLMPLAVLIVAVAVLHDAVGDAAACLIGAAAWIGVLQAGNFLSRAVRRYRSGNERC